MSLSAQAPPYTGRFAPSPSGPLHAGSLIAALASFLDAKAKGGEWLVRMEDLDPPRETQKAARQILKGLELLGLHWDRAVLYQSQRLDAYRQALDALREQAMIFPCDCSRQRLRASAGLYPGTCRQRNLKEQEGMALRCRVGDEPIAFHDLIQGRQTQRLQGQVGDFIIRRKDGFFAYQLAVVVDDAFQGIDHVVRGADLLDSTPRQLYLQQLLGLPSPRYGHIPIIVNAAGQKLSKQAKARPVDLSKPVEALYTGLEYLRQRPDPRLKSASRDELLAWGLSHWDLGKLRGIREVRE